MPPPTKVYINGIDAITGQYLVEPMDYAEIYDLVKSERKVPAQLSYLRRIWQAISISHLGVPVGIEPSDVKQAGWGIVFHKNEEQAVKDALGPLIEHRQRQIANDQIVKVLEYQDGESSAKWLARHGIARGSIVPKKAPYYLLLIGGPELIPFSFCHELDVEYAIGLLHFDTADAYKQYAESVIAYETESSIPNSKEAVFFATRHSGDRATELSSDYLINPLADGDPTEPSALGVAARWGFRSRKISGAAATKAALTEVLNRAEGKLSPAFVFTATHGLGFPKGHIKQAPDQGGLLCQDWPGLGAVTSDNYFAAEDLSSDSAVFGQIAFCFACFGAGTPSHDRFIHRTGKQPAEIAERPFLSALPKRLLSHPAGAALAFIGHVERAWGCSIVTPNAGVQLLPFDNAIARILKGEPVGHALKDFNERYAALSTNLTNMLEQITFGRKVPEAELAAAWVERNDSEGYVVLGDPAVSLRIHDLH